MLSFMEAAEEVFSQQEKYLTQRKAKYTSGLDNVC